MGMKKAGSTVGSPTPAATTAAPVQEAPKAAAPGNTDSGTAAAVSRLKKAATQLAPAAAKSSGVRDYNEEARGKTRCAAYGAALASNYIPGLPVKNIDEYLENVKKVADAMVAYTFGE